MNAKFFLLAGGIAGLLAVILGAFGAHGLEKAVSAKALSVFKTGVQYQFYHAFALIISGILYHLSQENKLFKLSGIAYLVGIFIFSGSLYLYTLTGIRTFGMITPLGGLSFMAGWLLLIMGLWKMPFASNTHS